MSLSISGDSNITLNDSVTYTVTAKIWKTGSRTLPGTAMTK